MQLHFTRDSVCMGDDMMDNSRNYELADDAVWLDIWELIRAKSFLPHVSGGNVVWLMMNNQGEEIFSYYVQQNIISKITIKNSLKQICGGANTLHFRYYVTPSERGKQLFLLYNGDTYSMWRNGVMEEYQHCQVTKTMEQEWRKDL